MNYSEAAFRTCLPSGNRPISVRTHLILLSVAGKSCPYALGMDFGSFRLNVSEQTSCFILAAIDSAQEAPQAILVADQVGVVPCSGEFLCFEAEEQRFSLPG